MEKVYLASYKATHTGLAGLINRVIRLVTKSQYSHSELVIADDAHPFDGHVLCISSAGMDGGVRSKVMRLDERKWDLIELPHLSPLVVLAFFSEHQGQGYDYVGCVRSVLPFVGCEHPSRWFCSELCATVLGHAEPWRMYPGVLHAVESTRSAGQRGVA